MALGGQGNHNGEDPSNNYYYPALGAWNKHIAIDLGIYTLKHDFEDINNVVVKNNTNNSSGTQRGNVKTDYGDLRMTSLHLLLPLLASGNLGVSIFSPLGHFIEINTGHPSQPEYVMYQSRYRRLITHINYAHPINDHWAFSLGALVGFQVRADLNTQASLNGSSFGSSASSRAKVSPALGGIFGITRKHDGGHFSFTFNQEMKSNLQANITGETSDPPIPFEVGADSLSFYDPHLIRFGWSQKGDLIGFFTALEYQLWENYQTPVVRIAQRVSLKSSDNFEQTKTQNIIVPRVGLGIDITDQMAVSVGAKYRPTPIKGDFVAAGNSVDTDTWTISTGGTYKMTLWSKKIVLSAAMAYQHLVEKDVTKTTGQENGTAGEKIGSPGYKIGGYVLVGAMGASITF